MFQEEFLNSKWFWWLALNIKCWIRNRIFVSIFTMKILMEKWIFQQEIWIFIIYSCEMSFRWQRSQWRMVPGAVGLLPTLFISPDINNIIFHNLIQPLYQLSYLNMNLPVLAAVIISQSAGIKSQVEYLEYLGIWQKKLNWAHMRPVQATPRQVIRLTLPRPISHSHFRNVEFRGNYVFT